MNTLDGINSIDPGTAFRVRFPLSGAQQERRDLFRQPSVQAQLRCTPFRTRPNWRQLVRGQSGMSSIGLETNQQPNLE
jgi:hypothetical protein